MRCFMKIPLINHHLIHILAYFHTSYFLQIKVCLPKNIVFFANSTKPISKPCEFPQWVHLFTICIVMKEDGERSVTWDFTLWKYSCSCLHIYMTKFSVQEFPRLLSFCVFQRFFVTLNSIIVSLDMIIRVKQNKKKGTSIVSILKIWIFFSFALKKCTL